VAISRYSCRLLVRANQNPEAGDPLIRELTLEGGLTVYCFGDPAKMSDPSSKLALRIHDEVNKSDPN